MRRPQQVRGGPRERQQREAVLAELPHKLVREHRAPRADIRRRLEERWKVRGRDACTEQETQVSLFAPRSDFDRRSLIPSGAPLGKCGSSKTLGWA
jgi:hypothetical protein